MPVLTVRHLPEYKYKLDQDYIEFDFTEYLYIPHLQVHHEFFTISNNVLIIQKGYAWDGSSGVLFQTENLKFPSLIHDVFYQIMELGLLNYKYRDALDQMYLKLCIKNDVFPLRAWLHYYVLKAAYPIWRDYLRTDSNIKVITSYKD